MPPLVSMQVIFIAEFFFFFEKDLYCRIWKVRSGKDHSYKCGKIAGYKCSLFVNSANDKGEAVKKKVILVC